MTKPHTLDDLRQWRIANGRDPEHGRRTANGITALRTIARSDLTLIRTYAKEWASWDNRQGEALVEIIAMCDRALKRLEPKT